VQLIALVLVFFGDSFSAGFGLKPEEAHPAIIQQRLGKSWQVINAGITGETTQQGLARLDRLLETKIDCFVLELGANDALRSLPIPQAEQYLQRIIDRVQTRYPRAIIVLEGLRAPLDHGELYDESFARIYPRLARRNGLPFVPFLLEGVADHPELLQADGVHPTAAGQKILADNVWKVLQPLLKSSM